MPSVPGARQTAQCDLARGGVFQARFAHAFQHQWLPDLFGSILIERGPPLSPIPCAFAGNTWLARAMASLRHNANQMGAISALARMSPFNPLPASDAGDRTRRQVRT
jgi:hypothetical protein